MRFANRNIGWAVLVIAPASGLAQDALNAPTSVAERTASWQRHVQLARDSLFAGLRWESRGPRKQGGRIECIARPAGRSATLYTGAGSGNLWASRNNGLTWNAIFERESTFAIGDIAIDPRDPNTIWVGTGEVLMARSSYAGTGVFKSTDGGARWHNVGLLDTHHIGRVRIDPRDSNVVYVAALGHLYTQNEERGLFKTMDGGASWRKILYVDERTAVTDVVFDPSDPDTLYATSWERDRKAWGHVAYGPGSGIHKSIDGGENWTKLTNGFPSGTHVGRVAVDVAPSSPRVVYAVTDCEGKDEGVYRSSDGGATWRKVNRDKIQAGYDFCMIRVSPDDANEIYVPGQRTYRSSDGGVTYEQIGGTIIHLLEHDASVLHLDAHALWIDPEDADHLVLGNDGGLYISWDRGATWLHVNNLPIGEFYAVAHDMEDPFRIYGGTQDNAALFGPITHTPEDGATDPWENVYLDPWGGGDSYFTWRDPGDASTIYYEHQFGAMRRKDMSTGESVRIRPRAAEGDPPLRFNWMTPFFLSPHDPETLYCGAQRVFKSTDRGDSWRPISPDLSTNPGPEKRGNVPYGTIATLSISPLVEGLVYAGTDDGLLHVTSDDGAHWKRIDRGLPAKWVSRVVASSHASRRVYATLTGYREDDFRSYVYRSEDRGASWQSIVANLPAESANAIAEDPASDKCIYLGTDLGVYVSMDRGTSWHSLCQGLPTTPVHDLFVHPREPQLVIGTHGRSVFSLNIEEIRARAMR